MNKNNSTQNLCFLTIEQILKKYNDLCDKQRELEKQKQQLIREKKSRYKEKTIKQKIREQKAKWKIEEERDENGRIIIRF